MTLGKTSSQEDTQSKQEGWKAGPGSMYGPQMIRASKNMRKVTIWVTEYVKIIKAKLLREKLKLQ